jgi:hypothetical protein
MFDRRFDKREASLSLKNAGGSVDRKFLDRKLLDRKFFAGRDLWIVLFLFLALSSYYLSSAYLFSGSRVGEGKRYAEVTVNGQVDKVVPLSENGRYSPAGLSAVEIAVREGMVGFVRSDCPDKICIHMGFLSLPGQSAVCLPNRVVVRVVAREGEEEALDGMTY